MTAPDTSGAPNAYDRLPDAVTDVFGEDATAAHAYDLLTVDVPAASWTAALETARDELGCTYFDWLSAVDEPGTGFRVCAHVAAVDGGTVRRLLVRTTVPHDAASLPTAVGVYAGAAWHERETHEMFGIGFEGHPHLAPLLLPENFEGHPLRKDFVLAARVAKAWPGAKEPGESEHGGPKRRTMLPPGVPDPNEWGPLKGQLPPAPARPARGARAAGERPVRRARSASEGSAAQRADAAAGTPATADAPATPATPDVPGGAEAPRTAPPRRTRSASQGSASQTAGPTPSAAGTEGDDASGPGTTGSAATGSVAPVPGAEVPGAEGSGSGSGGTGPRTTPSGGARGGRGAARAAGGAASSADAPWHDARPAFDEAPERPVPDGEPSEERKKPSQGSPPAAEGTDAAEAAEGTEATEAAEGTEAAEQPPAAGDGSADDDERTDHPDHPDRPAGGDTA
ncbi:NADH-quinone oxidoreductase subunit C [Streptomyces sp. NPDC051840]|uniref:NADH-quinone oxidoreductase subunit C n=1 Tax=Streptomyces sp. NPDC051840 TaxID=3154752 RepID=UPI003443BA35